MSLGRASVRNENSLEWSAWTPRLVSNSLVKMLITGLQWLLGCELLGRLQPHPMCALSTAVPLFQTELQECIPLLW